MHDLTGAADGLYLEQGFGRIGLYLVSVSRGFHGSVNISGSCDFR